MSKRRRQRGATAAKPKQPASTVPLLSGAAVSPPVAEQPVAFQCEKPPSDEERWADEVNGTLIEVHTKRRSELGIDDSGLFAHYSMLIDRGAILRNYERSAFDLVWRSLPRFDEYAVLRAGLGELAFLLGRAGLRVTAYESNSRRHAALVAGHEELASRGLIDREKVKTSGSLLPTQVESGSILAVATDFAYNIDLERDEAFRRALRQIDALLFLPSLFIRARSSADEERAAMTFLRSLGFTEIVEYPKERMVFMARAHGWRDREAAVAATDGPVTPVSSAMQSAFDSLVERVISLVPPAPPASAGSTWVDRRVRQFDMKSAFGTDR